MSDLVLTDLHKRFDEHVVLAGLDLTVPAGSFTALLGPSGVGKTTLLRLLAGFERPDRGTIAIGGRTVVGEHTNVRPDQRRIGYVPQEGSLFPHLTVAGNVGFGLTRSLRRAAVAELLELVGMAELGKRYPHELSGGQQQRVALARALAIKPEVVLLDEPFASLDVQLREGVREEVRRILHDSGTTTVLVTHNQDEALSVADLVGVVRDGRVVQCATPHTLYCNPVDSELARFIGQANLIDGTLEDELVTTALGMLSARCDGERPAARAPVTVMIRPEQITVETAGDGLTGRVLGTGYHGHDTVLQVELAGALVLVRAQGATPLAHGDAVTLTARGPVLVWPRDTPRPA